MLNPYFAIEIFYWMKLFHKKVLTQYKNQCADASVVIAGALCPLDVAITKLNCMQLLSSSHACK